MVQSYTQCPCVSLGDEASHYVCHLNPKQNSTPSSGSHSCKPSPEPEPELQSGVKVQRLSAKRAKQFCALFLRERFAHSLCFGAGVRL